METTSKSVLTEKMEAMILSIASIARKKVRKGIENGCWVVLFNWLRRWETQNCQMTIQNRAVHGLEDSTSVPSLVRWRRLTLIIHEWACSNGRAEVYLLLRKSCRAVVQYPGNEEFSNDMKKVHIYNSRWIRGLVYSQDNLHHYCYQSYWTLCSTLTSS